MKEVALHAPHIGGKLMLAYIALLAAREQVPYYGWFVFLAVAYALGTSLKVN